MTTFVVDMVKVRRGFNHVAQRQIPFATALALNDTAKDIAEEWPRVMERDLRSPTPFTKRGAYVKRASKRRLTAQVDLKRVQKEYLKLQLEGGVRRPKRRAVVVPAGVRVNKYGNMARGAVGKALARKDTFVASSSSSKTRHLKPGIYQRKRGRGGDKRRPPKMLVSFRSRARYQKRLDLQQPSLMVVRRKMSVNFYRRYSQALATAR